VVVEAVAFLSVSLVHESRSLDVYLVRRPKRRQRTSLRSQQSRSSRHHLDVILDAPHVLRRHQQLLQRDRDAEVVQLIGLRSFTTTYERLQLIRFRLSAKFSFTSGSHFRGSQELIASTQLSRRIFTWHM
jgi:hypothetical protein